MTETTPNPSSLAARLPPRQGTSDFVPSSENELPERIRSFAFFLYRGEQDLHGPEAGEQAWTDALDSLACLAEDEEWTGLSASRSPLLILNQYLRYTYQRLAMEKKIKVSEDGEYASFNTGLLTRHSEEIFGFFQRNKAANAQPWFFLRWATESDRDIMRFFPEAPQLAEYFLSAGDLVYDWRRELKFNFEHILGDNIDRFPQELQDSPARARSALVSAADLTLKRVRRNYKLIVPQWYPNLGEDGSGFFMPLDLLHTGTTDLALVVSTVGERTYRAHTVLTLEMAYANARLVARPDSDWLKPQAPAIDPEDNTGY